jgi:hypothetical protein
MTDVIQDYIESLDQDWQIDISRQLYQTIQDAIPEADKRIQYGKPHYLKDGKYIAVFGVAKGWVSLTIFNATELVPPDGLFERSENGERITIKIKKGQAVDQGLLGDLLKQAVQSL